MGVAKKGRRCMEYKGQRFVWWVGADEDSCDEIWLNIISEDKGTVIAYRVGEGDFCIISKGRTFQNKKTSGCWERYEYPMSSPPMVITPNFVHELIAWSVDGRIL